jgi:hypothetical protein
VPVETTHHTVEFCIFGGKTNFIDLFLVGFSFIPHGQKNGRA